MTATNTMKPAKAAELREEARRCMGDIASNIKRIAEICVELENAGEEWDEFYKIVPGGVHRSIAEGHMLPETYLALGGINSRLMKTVASLPISKQQELCVLGKTIEVAEQTPAGVTLRNYPITKLPEAFIGQVFDNKRIRTYEEQKVLKPEPVTAVKCHPADFAAIAAQAASAVETLQNEEADRRAKRRAAKQLCDAAGKLLGFLA